MNYTRLAVTLMTAFPLLAAASGYHVGTQSTSNQGVANSGAAGVFDASTVFYNPAGLTRLKGTHFSVVGTYAIPSASFTPGSSSIYAPDFTGATAGSNNELSGNNGGEFVESTLIPHFYFSSQLSDQFTFGVGAFIPFGSKTSYDPDWVGRYNIVSTELVTVAVNPSIGWKLTDSLSLGAGVSTQYMSGKLARKVNFGGGALKAIPSLVVPDNPGATTALRDAARAALLDMNGNPAYDGSVDIDGTDWSYGFNLGLMWDITPSTRMGAAYRSKVRHTLSGDADWNANQSVGAGMTSRLTPIVGAGTAGALGAGTQANINSTYVDSGATVDVDTPESFSLNAYSQLTSRWALMADFTWTGHSSFQELRVDFASSVPDSITVEDWTDTTRWSIGSTFKYSDRLTLRGGLALDLSPVDDDNRTASIPDNTRTWYSAGLSYSLSPDSVIDLAYTYVNVKGSTISHTDDADGEPSCACSYATLNGSYKLHSHLIGMQYSMKF